MNSYFKVLFCKLFIFVLFVSVSKGVSAANKYTKDDISKGKKLFAKKCVPCHGIQGEGIVGSSIGCHGVKNKTDSFLFKTIYNGRKGDHGVDMPSWGAGGMGALGFEESVEFRKSLTMNKTFSKERIDELIGIVYGAEIDLFQSKKRGKETISELGGPLTAPQIKQVVGFIRSMEIAQEKNVPSECIVKKEAISGNLKNGKNVYENKCSKCHAKKGDVDEFFLGKGVSPRNFNDSVYMNSISNEYLKNIIKYGGLSNGRSGIMAPMGLSDEDLVDVITYIRTLSDDKK